LAPATEQAKKRVLVVDDSKFVRKTFATILRGTFDVGEAAESDSSGRSSCRGHATNSTSAPPSLGASASSVAISGALSLTNRNGSASDG
jgi:CheY-like chemotaxis protein